MEQKRILWIVLASGIFLLVVTGAALLYTMTSRSGSPAVISDSTVWTAPPATLSQQAAPEPYGQGIASAIDTAAKPAPASAGSAQDAAAPQIAQTDNLTVIANGTTNIYGVAGTDGEERTTTIDLNELKNAYPSASPVAAQNAAAESAMREAEKASPAVAKTTEPQETASRASASDGTSSAAKSTGTASASGSAKSASSGSGTKTAAPSAKTAASASSSKTTAGKTAEPIADRFWVQAASYSNKKNADEARSLLDESGIQCEVFTYTDAKGTLFYRVRVGPYTTKSEAEYWKQRIDGIEMFAKNGTYITNSSAPAIAKK